MTLAGERMDNHNLYCLLIQWIENHIQATPYIMQESKHCLDGEKRNHNHRIGPRANIYTYCTIIIDLPLSFPLKVSH